MTKGIGLWVKPSSPYRNSSYWHWVHRVDPTTYCGLQRPKDPLATEPLWNPMVRCCRKCLTRIAREGY